MAPQAGHPASGERLSRSPGDGHANFRRLLALLTSRARRFGSRDPEGAAQEALRRSLENTHSQSAIAYYFSDDLAAGVEPPEWPLDQLYAWLHGVLRYVVREEHHRASSRREVSTGAIGSEGGGENRSLDPPDPEPDQLDALLRKEMQGIVAGCFPMLDREYRTVLRMRVDGLKYGEIASRLGISENTVATWVSRGTGALAQHVRRRMERVISLPRSQDRAKE
jgi:RNA polymerase sigma factor (sigma-70 family)